MSHIRAKAQRLTNVPALGGTATTVTLPSTGWYKISCDGDLLVEEGGAEPDATSWPCWSKSYIRVYCSSVTVKLIGMSGIVANAWVMDDA